MSRPPSQPSPLSKARERLRTACMRVAAVIDTGEFDPHWHETQELEQAAIAYGRLLNKLARVR